MSFVLRREVVIFMDVELKTARSRQRGFRDVVHKAVGVLEECVMLDSLDGMREARVCVGLSLQMQ